MNTFAAELSEFYHELSVLTRANMPLPQALEQLQRDLKCKRLRSAISALTRDVQHGAALSSALQKQRHVFRPFHVQIIRLGEKTGAIADVLGMLARFARLKELTSGQMREIMAYPLMTIHLSVVVFGAFSIWIAPELSAVINELYKTSAQLPALSAFVISVCLAIHQFRLIFMVLYAGSLGATLWLFSPFANSQRALLWVTNLLPGAYRIRTSIDSARLCHMWSAFLQHEMPIHQSLSMMVDVTEGRALHNALSRLDKHVQSGVSLQDAVGKVAGMEPLLVTTIVHTPEKALAEELAHLAVLYEQRAHTTTRTAMLAWNVIATVLMALIVGAIIIAVFLPLNGIITMLACYA
jgi:type II secretory pathway component PulF